MVSKVATRDAYGDALVSLGKKRNDVVVLDADLSGSTKTAKFAKVFPDRFFNIGIAEQDMMGTAAGLALGGKLPFVSTFAVFATGRAWEQVRQSICYPNLNVKIVASHAGVTVGEDGGSHQAIEDIAVMRVIPHMTVIVPADGPETLQAIEAVAEYKGPCYVRTGRNKVPTVCGEDYKFQIGKAHIISEGRDAAIIATGIMVAEAMKARDLLKAEGVDAGVINMSTIKPLDAEAVVSAAKRCGAIVTAEEHSIIGGLGGAVAEVLAESFPAPLVRVGVKDTFGTSGEGEGLMKHFGLSAADIATAVKSVLAKKRSTKS
ncbi:MAG TPA: transketolase family protein [Nitrospirota bacterium]|nr:transketolase family protein [Nitrospirota bacterium]